MKQAIVLALLYFFLRCNAYSKENATIVIVAQSLKGQKAELPGVAKDVQNISNAFKHFNQNLKIVSAVDESWDETKIKIMKEISLIPRDGYFVIYFTGHGEKGSGNFIFADPETNTKSIDATEFAKTLAIGRASFNHKVFDGGIPGYGRTMSKFILIVDSCYSGHWVDGNKSVENFDAAIKKRVFSILGVSRLGKTTHMDEVYDNYFVMAASHDNEAAYQGNKTGSFFTSALSEVILSPNAKDFSFKDLSERVSTKMRENLKKAGGQETLQHSLFTSTTEDLWEKKGLFDDKPMTNREQSPQCHLIFKSSMNAESKIF